MNLVVTDTGPLLHLRQAGAAGLLTCLGTVHATPVVLEELRRHDPAFFKGSIPAWLIQARLSGQAAQKARRWVLAQVIDPGEAESLAYAEEVHADFFLTDDSSARTLAESLGIHVRGTLGVVLYAAASGRLDQTVCLEILSNIEQHSTLWMSARVKAAARKAVSLIFGGLSA